jgi:hypothetical protein
MLTGRSQVIRPTLFACIVSLCSFEPAHAQQAQDDILAILIAQPGMTERLGIKKLTQAELDAWNEVLNLVMTAGAQLSGSATSGLPTAPAGSSTEVFESRVYEASGEVVELANGAIVEVTGYLGYVGYRRNAVLVREGRSWRLWIEGGRSYSVRMVRPPGSGGRAAERISVVEILGDGAVLRLMDGRLLEVDDFNRVFTSIWLPFFDGLLIGGYELLNFDSGEKVTVQFVR